MRTYTSLRDVCAPYGGKGKSNSKSEVPGLAIFHFSAQVIGRSTGRSSVAAAAYRHAERLEDERTGLVHDYTKKAGVVEVVVMAPSNAPAWAQTAHLWQEVERVEKRKDAQLCREINVALPVELNHDQRRALLLDYCREQFVSRGMVADVSFHEPDSANPHAHVMLTTREIGPDGFGQKNREWNARELLDTWREQWATHTNRALELAEQPARVDHRSIAAQQAAAIDENRIGDAIRLHHSPTKHHGNRPESTAHQHNAEAVAEKVAAAQMWERWHADEMAKQQEHARQERRAAQRLTPDKPAPAIERDKAEQAWKDGWKNRAEQTAAAAEAARQSLGRAGVRAAEASAEFDDAKARLIAAKAARQMAGQGRVVAREALAEHEARWAVRLGFGKTKTKKLREALDRAKIEEQRSRDRRDEAGDRCAIARDRHTAAAWEFKAREAEATATATEARVAAANWAAVEAGRVTYADHLARLDQEQRRQARQATRQATPAITPATPAQKPQRRPQGPSLRL